MFDDTEARKPRGHEVGMSIDSMSVEELQERIIMLEAEIVRLQDALAVRGKTKAAAESIFKL